MLLEGEAALKSIESEESINSTCSHRTLGHSEICCRAEMTAM